MDYRRCAVQTVTNWQVDAPTDENAAPAPVEPIAEEPEAEATADTEHAVSPDVDRPCRSLSALRSDHTRCTYSEKGSVGYG